MIAVGGAQLATGFFSGYPVSASSSRTALARSSGATSKHYSLVVAVMILLAPILIGGLLEKIPQAGLAGIILYAAISLIELPEWRKLRRLHRNEFAIAASCTIAVLLFGILPGIGFAIAASVVAFLARLARPTASVLGFTPMSQSMHAVDKHKKVETVPGLVVFRYEAPLFFINAPDFFTDEDIDTFFATAWEVHYNSSRTGIRLIGPRPQWARRDGGEAGLHPSNIHDNAYAIGAIDFTGDMPVILGPDGPSLGGFVCPATIVQAELWKLGQLKPGDTVRFKRLTRDQANALQRGRSEEHTSELQSQR